MIKELKGKHYFFRNDPVSKYFYDRKTTEHEEQKMDELKTKMRAFAKKVGISDCGLELAGYLDDYGYYKLWDEHRSKIGLMYLGEDIDEVFDVCIRMTLSSISNRYEFLNRKELQNDFKIRFHDIGFVDEVRTNCILDNYCPQFYYYEYELGIYDKYYEGNIPQEIVERYTNSLNNFWWSKEQGVKWEYDYNTKKFNCSKIKQEKVLTK